jgi:hypothetical protein
MRNNPFPAFPGMESPSFNSVTTLTTLPSFGNKMLRRIFGIKREDVSGG